MNRTTERLYPFVIGIAAGTAWYLLKIEFPQGKADTILSSTLTFGAILTGFIATAKTILMSLKGSRLFRTLVSSGYIKDLVSFLRDSIITSLLFCIASFVGFFIGVHSCYFGAIWIGLAAMSLSAFWRVIGAFLTILAMDT